MTTVCTTTTSSTTANSTSSGTTTDTNAGAPATDPGESLAVLQVVPWPDAVIDHLGYDPRSRYVELFWLPILGPSTTFLLRLLAARFDACPHGFELDRGATALALGLGRRSGRHSPFNRTLVRCRVFGTARLLGPDEMAVRRKLPPLPHRYAVRLPPALQHAHELHRKAITNGPTPTAG